MQDLKIGDVQLSGNLLLGPMAGVSDLPFRLLCREMGASLVCTEMVSAKAVTFKNKNTKELLITVPQEHPCALQLFGSDPEIIAEAAVMLEDMPYEIFDLNMGCPVPKVAGNGEGSALMKDPKKVEAIVSTLTKAVKKPVTVKIRKGFNDALVNAPEIARIAEAAGAAAVTVHGRTREQYYSGEADWEIIRQVKEAVKIPVIGNGDITSPELAKKMLEETGCDGIMVGRGARGNPWIFRRIRTYLEEGTDPGKPSRSEVHEMILRHARMEVEHKGEYTAIREMRKHVAWYTTGYPHSARLRAMVNEAETLEQLEALLTKVFL